MTYELGLKLYRGSGANKLLKHQIIIMNNIGDSCNNVAEGKLCNSRKQTNKQNYFKPQQNSMQHIFVEKIRQKNTTVHPKIKRPKPETIREIENTTFRTLWYASVMSKQKRTEPINVSTANTKTSGVCDACSRHCVQCRVLGGHVRYISIHLLRHS